MTKVHVVVQTAFIGDLFLSIPTLERVRRTNPDHQIILVCKKGLGQFFLKNKIVDYVYEVTKGDASSYKNVLKDLKNFDVDHVYCIHRSLRSALFTLQIKAQKKIGFGSFLHLFFFSEVVNYPQPWPDAIRQMSILTPVDPVAAQEIQKSDWTYLNHKKADGTFEVIPEFFKIHSTPQKTVKTKKIALFPGSVWATKRWTVEGYTAVAQALIRQGYVVLLMGGPDELSICQAIADQVPQVTVLAGKMNLEQSISQIKECDLIICNDSAPSHMAASVGTQVICIFGPTTLDLGFRPWIEGARVVENLNLDCRPCGKHGHQKCPLDHHKCMKDITAAQVLSAAALKL